MKKQQHQIVQVSKLRFYLSNLSNTLSNSNTIPGAVALPLFLVIGGIQLTAVQVVFLYTNATILTRNERARLASKVEGGEKKKKTAAPQSDPRSWPSPPPPHTTGPCTPARR